MKTTDEMRLFEQLLRAVRRPRWRLDALRLVQAAWFVAYGEMLVVQSEVRS